MLLYAKITGAKNIRTKPPHVQELYGLICAHTIEDLVSYLT